jgi:DNA-binding HxlR family transcriptional regulator
MSIVDLEQLCALGQNRWAVPLMAMLSEGGGARFVVMLNQLGIARESLARTLGAVMELGWVIRNPGHGHPLRPEYILTPKGETAARTCQKIADVQNQLGLKPTDFTRWSLPAIWLIVGGQNRFNGIERALPGVNPRALTQSLKAMIAADLIERSVIAGYPPVTQYALTERGSVLADVLKRS